MTPQHPTFLSFPSKSSSPPLFLNKKADEIHFTFTLLNSDSWHEPTSLILDLSDSAYKVKSHSGLLSESTLQTLLDQLNKDRKFYTFIKKLRGEMKAEFDRRRSGRRNVA